MKSNLIFIVDNTLKALLYFICISFVFVFVYAVINRIFYPFDLEWIEGASADNVQRILNNQQIYVFPTTEFVPFIYTPLYFYICALFSNIVGFSLLPMRLISVICTFGCCIIIFLFVYRSSKHIFSSIMALSFFLACYYISGAWFDLARLDMLLILLLLLGLYILYYSKSYISIIISGIIFALAFFTKQNSSFIIILALIYSLTKGIKQFILLTMITLLSIIFGIIIFDYYSNNWFSYYIYKLSVDIFNQTFNINRLITIWSKDLFGTTAIAFSLSLYYIFNKLIKNDMREWAFYVILLFGFILISINNRVIVGGYVNALIPFYAFISIMLGLSYNYINVSFINNKRIYAVFLNLIVLAQFINLVYDPLKLIPNQNDVKAGTDIVKMVKNTKGNVIILSHGQIAQMAGKESSMHMSALDDILCSSDNEVKNALVNDIKNKIRNKEFGAIIVDNIVFKEELSLIDEIDDYYIPIEIKYDDPYAFYPKSDMSTRPKIMYIPK